MQERIIQFLKESDGYISGEEMSQRLKMSRAAIWKHMQELRAQGYEIAAVPHLGYQLVTCPEKLLSFEIQSGLNTKIIGKKMIVMDTVTSTMDEAFRLGNENCPEGTVVCAEAQSKGRGRLGRAWTSPKGKGLYFSFVLRPSLPLNQLAQLTLMSAVALAEAIEDVSELKPSIKWPNDILLEGRKLAGILTELRAESDQVKFIIVGIGLNVNTSQHQLVPGAISLKSAAGNNFNRTQVFQAILRSLEKWYVKLLHHEFDQVMEEWKKRSATLKKRVRITDPAGMIEGEAIDLDEDGALLIRKDNGVIVKKTAGDVFFIAMNTTILKKDLQELENSGIYRSLKTIDSPQGREITLEGKRVLNFSSNDYLGLANDARIKRAAIEAIKEYGLGTGASRLVCGNMYPHEKLEEDLARFKNTESALVYSSGYMANTGIIPALVDRHSIVLSDKLNHASIIDGIILSRAKLVRYHHGDMQALQEILKDLPVTKQKLIVTDTVFSMDGDRAPLKEIVDLARRYEAMTMVDEAHAFGVLGTKGSGLVEELGLENEVDIQMGTLSKAAGCMGAYVCGTKVLRDYLINKSRSFIYTTAMPPSLAQAARKALQIIHQEEKLRRQLQKNADYLRAELKTMGFDTMHSSTPIIPILVKDPTQAVAMSKRLLQQGIFVQAIRPPTVPMGTARLRLTVTAAHTQDDLDHLLNVLRKL